MVFFNNDIKKIKINKIGDNFWFQPSIFIASKRKYAARPYKSLMKLLKNEALLSQEFIFTFNSDENFELFRFSQTQKGIKFYLNGTQINEIKTNGFIEHNIQGTNITIRYDKKSLVDLSRGYTPYFSVKWIKENFRSKNSIIIKWTKKGYIEI